MILLNEKYQETKKRFISNQKKSHEIENQNTKKQIVNFTRFAVSEQLSRNHTKRSKPEITEYKYMRERERRNSVEWEGAYTSR